LPRVQYPRHTGVLGRLSRSRGRTCARAARTAGTPAGRPAARAGRPPAGSAARSRCSRRPGAPCPASQRLKPSDKRAAQFGCSGSGATPAHSMQASACRTGARSSRVSRARLPSDPAHPVPSSQARGRAGAAHHSHGCSATRPSSAVPASAASGLACSPYQCRSASSCTRRVSVSRPGSGIAPSEGAMHQGSIARPERRRAPAGAKSYAAGAAQNGQTSKQGELGGRRRLAGLARRRQRVCSGDTTRRAGRGRLAPARPCSTRARARRGGSAPRSRKSSAPAPPAPPATNSAAGHCSAAAARACRPVRLQQSACRVCKSACKVYRTRKWMNEGGSVCGFRIQL